MLPTTELAKSLSYGMRMAMTLAERRERINGRVETWQERWQWYRRYGPLIAAGTGGSLWLAAAHPYMVAGGVSTAGLLHSILYKEPESDDIQDLRRALGTIIGTDTKDRPPKVTQQGEHTAGGPRQTIIEPIPGWEYWKDGKWNDMDRAVKYRLGPDWERVHQSAGQGLIWERLPVLPDKVDFPGLPIPGGSCKRLAVGPNGVDGLAWMDFTEENGRPHWLLLGDSREGKTILLGNLGTQLLDYRDDIAGLVLIDIKGVGLKRFSGREGVIREALGDYYAIEATVAWLHRELYERKALALQGQWRKPLFVLWDELAETFRDARALGKHVGVKADGEPKTTGPLQIEAHAMSLAALSGEYGIHIIGADQRGDGTSMATPFRAQLKGRVVLGRAGDQKAAEMAVGAADAPRLLNMTAVKGRCLVKGLDDCGYAQAWRLANPHSPAWTDRERKDAEKLLPPKRPVRIADADGTEDGTVAEFGASVQVEMKSKREPSDASTGAGTGAAIGTRLGTGEETPVQRSARLNAEATARWRKKAAKRILDPDDDIHGTKAGRTMGCLCEPCKTLTPRGRRLEVAS